MVQSMFAPEGEIDQDKLVRYDTYVPTTGTLCRRYLFSCTHDAYLHLEIVVCGPVLPNSPVNIISVAYRYRTW